MPTSTTAIPMASVKPRRNTAISAASSTRVITTCWPWKKLGASSTSTNTLPAHHGSRCSSMAMEPSPLGLSFATRRYTGRAPSSVSRTSTRVASGDSVPAASAAMPGW